MPLTPDQITRATPLTEAELQALRAHVIGEYSTRGLDLDKFTCDECGARFQCELVFDAYNTDGDCLAEK